MPSRRAVQTNTHSAIPKRALALGVLVLIIAAVLHRAFNSAQSPVPSIKPKKLLDADSLKLLEMVRNSISVDPEFDQAYPGSDEERLCREAVLESVSGLLDFSAGRADLETALNLDLKILCLPEEYLIKNNMAAGFNTLTKRVWFSASKDPSVSNVSPVIVIHETRHFLRHMRHQTPECMMPALTAQFPIYLKVHQNPQTRYEIDASHLPRYNHVKEAVNEGISIIKEFQRMWIATEGGQKLEHLSKNERQTFKMYCKVARSCLNTRKLLPKEFPKEYYQMMLDLGWRPDNTDVVIPTHFPGDVHMNLKILSVTDRGNRIFVTMEEASNENSIFQIITKLDFKPTSSYYRRAEMIKVLEKVEVALQSLSREAMETFFPALRKMIDADEANCPLPVPASRNTATIS